MEDMDYKDIFKCLPKEKQKELFDMKICFSEQTGIENLLLENQSNRWIYWKIYPDKMYLQKECFMRKTGMKSKYLLDIFVKIRTVKALDKSCQQ